MNVLFTCIWQDEIEDFLEFKVVAENNDFKGTTTFYDNRGSFIRFANVLLQFPFDNKEDIVFTGCEYMGEPAITLTFSLNERRGLIETRVAMHNNNGDRLAFSDYAIETQMLHDFARKLLMTEFTLDTEVILSSKV